MRRFKWLLLLILSSVLPQGAQGADWPMVGFDYSRNRVSNEKNPPTWFQLADEESKLENVNIKFRQKISDGWGVSHNDPIIKDGLIWIGVEEDGEKVEGGLQRISALRWRASMKSRVEHFTNITIPKSVMVNSTRIRVVLILKAIGCGS